MKTNYLFLSLALGALLLGSCEADDTADIVINNTDNSVTNNNGGGETPPDENPTGEDIDLQGTLTEDLVLDAENNYTLTGSLVMTRGTKLTIPAGTVIRANRGANVYIAISQGAEIDAQGTANAPIILTSSASSPAAGDWGGLILLGRAPINSTAGGNTATSEIGGLPYGGDDASDYSGVIKYMRIEYSGGAIDGDNENNGYSFYGVGNATIIDHIQMFIGSDDGLEFYGGTVNASFVSVIGSEDDSVDWTEGWSGTITDVYIQQVDYLTEYDKAIEADGFNTDIGNNSSPVYYSLPTINRLTIIGLGSENDNEAVRLRAGTGAIFNEVYIEGYAEAFDLDGDMGDSPTGQQVIDGNLNVSNVNFANVTVKLKNDTGFEFEEGDFILSESDSNGTDYADWGSGWTRNEQ
ncbi:MAG: multidrug transporter [Leeuwenhoekiella sp.]